MPSRYLSALPTDGPAEQTSREEAGVVGDGQAYPVGRFQVAHEIEVELLKPKIRAVTSMDAPRPAGAYSQAVVSGGLVFVSGQVPREPLTGIVPDGLEAQTQLVLRNVNSILQATGLSLKDVVKISAYLADLALFDEFNRIYSEFFVQPFPARTTVGSQLRGVLVEVDAIAVIANDRPTETSSAPQE